MKNNILTKAWGEKNSRFNASRWVTVTRQLCSGKSVHLEVGIKIFSSSWEAAEGLKHLDITASLCWRTGESSESCTALDGTRRAETSAAVALRWTERREIVFNVW
ncbi:hypothetical protein AAFF_G00359830 [Aldrovandia affinis]|uniref:Uncharacterized protein n=1 Tax=Aldrovandia affinis TaxID=143900 RepID=A0AAD7SI75_9TELE|nr:hypothetical protein AAFF_G00359830 [Aldrovandia affinis]